MTLDPCLAETGRCTVLDGRTVSTSVFYMQHADSGSINR